MGTWLAEESPTSELCYHKPTQVPMKSARYSFPILTVTGKYRKMTVKFPSKNVMKIRSVALEFPRTDRRGASSQLPVNNALKIHNRISRRFYIRVKFGLKGLDWGAKTALIAADCEWSQGRQDRVSLYSDNLHYLCHSPNIISDIKLKKTRRERYAQMTNATKL